MSNALPVCQEIGTQVGGSGFTRRCVDILEIGAKMETMPPDDENMGNISLFKQMRILKLSVLINNE